MAITITEKRVQDQSSNDLNIEDIINIVYPVGSYYWSSNATSPSKLFGGTWEQIKDRFVLAAGDNYNVGSSGGEASHVLSVDEMPSHNHSITFYNNDFSNGGDGETDAGRKKQSPGLTYDVAWKIGGWQYSSNAIGGNVAHNNMPPYVTAYCWHRVA